MLHHLWCHMNATIYCVQWCTIVFICWGETERDPHCTPSNWGSYKWLQQNFVSELETKQKLEFMMVICAVQTSKKSKIDDKIAPRIDVCTWNYTDIGTTESSWAQAAAECVAPLDAWWVGGIMAINLTPQSIHGHHHSTAQHWFKCHSTGMNSEREGSKSYKREVGAKMWHSYSVTIWLW